MFTINYAAHTAHLDPVTGTGLLVLPRPCDDVTGFGTPTLHQATWNHVVRELDAIGWEPLEECGEFLSDGYSRDGRQVIGLYGREPIVSDPDLDQYAESTAELLRLAGVPCAVSPEVA